MTVLFAFHSMKGYTIRYEEILAISINIIMVIEMSPSERVFRMVGRSHNRALGP